MQSRSSIQWNEVHSPLKASIHLSDVHVLQKFQFMKWDTCSQKAQFCEQTCDPLYENLTYDAKIEF